MRLGWPGSQTWLHFTAAKNPAASNFELKKEKESYFFGKDSTISTFALINNLREINEWTSEVLKDRQNDLLGRLYKHSELN